LGGRVDESKDFLNFFPKYMCDICFASKKLYYRTIKMARQKTLQCMFIVIGKEEMEDCKEKVQFL